MEDSRPVIFINQLRTYLAARSLVALLAMALLPINSGCASSRRITDLRGALPKDQAGLPYHATVDAVLRHYFTDKAYAAVKDIPLIDGPSMSGYAAGTTFWSNLVSLLSLNGIGRKVIFPKELLRKEWGVEGIVHEYIHHLDDMDRDGEADFINHAEFRKAFIRLEGDFTFAWIAINANRKQAEFPWAYHVFFSVGDLSERIAYTGGQMAVRKTGPDYAKRVFRKILRFR